MTTILRIDGSARRVGSATRDLTDQTVARLLAANPGAQVITRDLLDGVPLHNETAISAWFTPAEEQTDGQSAVIAASDTLIDEFAGADIVVLGSPIYNFSVPAAVKAYIDQITRAGRTFQYTEQGPVGLLVDRPTYLVTASGGTEVGGEGDFATTYLRHLLAFLGVTSVEVIGADMLMVDAEAAMARAHSQLDAVLPAVAV